MNLSVKVTNGLSTCSTLIYPNFLCKNKDSYTTFQIAAVVWFLSLTLSKTKILCRHLRFFTHFSLILEKSVIASIALFTYLSNKIVLNSLLKIK